MKKVFIIDDSPEFIFLIESLFKLKGLSLDVETDASNVLDRIKSESYDLIIVDFLMPGTNGLEVIKKIRAIESYIETPLVLLTAKKLDNQEMQTVKENGVLFLQKPIQPTEFYNKVSGLIKG